MFQVCQYALAGLVDWVRYQEIWDRALIPGRNIEDQGHGQWGCGHWGPKALQFVGHSQTETGKSTCYAKHVRCSSIIVAIIYFGEGGA